MSGVLHAQGSLLAQVRPSVTTPVVLFQADKLRVEVTLIVACILHAAPPGGVDIEFYHDDNGVTYTIENQLSHQVKLKTATPDAPAFQAQHPGSGVTLSPGGSIGIAVDTADVVTFSIYGVTETLAERVRGLSNG